MECRPARREETHAAVRLILGTGGRSASEAQAVDFMRYALDRHIDLGALWVAARGGHLAWATLPIVSPGHTLLLLAPEGFASPQVREAADRLLPVVLDHHAGRGVQLAQVLLEGHEPETERFYTGHAFERMETLLYLQGHLRRRVPRETLPADLAWQTYSPATHAVFARTILESYRDSLDCPQLAGRRHIDDVMNGHKATGEFHPDLWFVLRHHDAPLGVLLLSPSPGTSSMELVYLGLTPAARGRGHGARLMRHALATTLGRGLTRLTLAVDVQNRPAMRLYFRHGMQRVCEKVALMRDLRPAAAPLVPGPAPRA